VLEVLQLDRKVGEPGTPKRPRKVLGRVLEYVAVPPYLGQVEVIEQLPRPRSRQTAFRRR
jgi:hypothetical protein